jgi:hypothetical protein
MMTNHQTNHASLKIPTLGVKSGYLRFKERDSYCNPTDYKHFAGGGRHV